MNYNPHPIADIFPLMLAEEFVALKEDIKTNGLIEPVWMYEGLILDGRSRCRACIESGVDIQVKEYPGNDPLGFVISLNLKRRHLNEAQRGTVAAKLANLTPHWTDNNTANLQFEVTRAEAEKLLLNVSEPTVNTANKIDQNVVSVSTATTLPTLDNKEQKPAVAVEALPLFEAETQKSPGPSNDLKPNTRQLIEQNQVADQAINPDETKANAKADKKQKKHKKDAKKSKKHKSDLDEQVKPDKKELSPKKLKKKKAAKK